ncbi:MAG: hypothetical protein Pars92KO_20470 [Parasphingorhabdus sp.]
MKHKHNQFDMSQAKGLDAGQAESLFSRIGQSFRKSHQNEQRETQAIDAEEAKRLVDCFETANLGWFWSTDRSGRLIYISVNTAKAVGKDISELVGSSFADLFETSENDAEQNRSLRFILTKHRKFADIPFKTADVEEDIWWDLTGIPQFDRDGEFDGFVGIGKDVTERICAKQEESRLAHYDSLTGLSNRALMSKKLDSTLSAFKQQKRACALLQIDLDRFKLINDTLGHPAGDTLLKNVADRLMRLLSGRGEVARVGGDEFQVLLPDWDDRGELSDLADAIISSLSQPYTVEGSRCVIGASVGIAISPFDGRVPEDLIRSADMSLYAAKGAGRGRFSFFSEKLLEAVNERKILEDDLRDALNRNEIELHYQPLVKSKTDKVSCFEALMRWNHHERGSISPGIFVPIAEETKLVLELGTWAIQRACQDAMLWPGKVRVAVNVSPIQFADPSLPKIVEQALKSSGLHPDRLELEITESVFLEETAETEEMFASLKRLGVRLALDDFGTGYSSLSYLQNAPFDKIKIDQSFVRGSNKPGSRNGAIIAAIVALADALKMDTTAEGIEAHDELAWIKSLNVSQIQGYIYSKPIVQEEVLGHFGSGEWKIEPEGPALQRDDRMSIFRKVRIIFGDSYEAAVVRNLSKSGALIEGLICLPERTKLVVDLGDGQLAVATVRRTNDNQMGVEFEQRLINDGFGGLCTRRRVSPYLIAAAGLPDAKSVQLAIS